MTEIVMLEGPDTRAQEVEVFRDEFLRQAAMSDLTRPCPIGRLTHVDWSDPELRRETIWEVVRDAMSERDEFERRAMVILCGLAKWHDEAKELLSDMAQHWAEQRSEL